MIIFEKVLHLHEIIFFWICLAALEDQPANSVWMDVHNPSGLRCNYYQYFPAVCEDLGITWGDGTTPLNSSGTITSMQIRYSPWTEGPYAFRTEPIHLLQIAETGLANALCEHY